MEVGVYASDWDRLPIGVYGLGEDDEVCHLRSVETPEKREEAQVSVLSVRPFAGLMACERSVRALNAWFSGVNVK